MGWNHLNHPKPAFNLPHLRSFLSCWLADESSPQRCAWNTAGVKQRIIQEAQLALKSFKVRWGPGVLVVPSEGGTGKLWMHGCGCVFIWWSRSMLSKEVLGQTIHIIYMLHAVCGLDRFYLLTSYHSSFDQEAHNNFILNRSVKTRISPSSSLFFKACWLPHVLELTLEKNKSLPPGSLQKKAPLQKPTWAAELGKTLPIWQTSPPPRGGPWTGRWWCTKQAFMRKQFGNSFRAWRHALDLDGSMNLQRAELFKVKQQSGLDMGPLLGYLPKTGVVYLGVRLESTKICTIRSDWRHWRCTQRSCVRWCCFLVQICPNIF